MSVAGRLRLARFALNCPSPEASAAFFIGALGFTRAGAGAGAHRAITLALGATRLDLTPTEPTARAYPTRLPPFSARFQHLALVTPDIAAAMDRLRQTPGWTAISRAGPERLPPRSGGVLAFKFRDPDGHPLELISFPSGDNAPRIDHSAISVAQEARSRAFYAALGLKVGSRSVNTGPEQNRLDGLRGADVEVTALIPPGAPSPHVELLCYRGDHQRGPIAGVGDVAATRLIFAVASTRVLEAIRADPPGPLAELRSWPLQNLLLRDPDGHLIGIEVEA